MNNGNDVFEKKEELNVWTSIWVKPRVTVRYAIEHKPMKFAVMLALIAGVFDMLNAATQNNFGDTMPVPVIIVLAIILGPILGVIGWWIGAGIAKLVGKWLGGVGNYEELKMALAIAYIPVILIGILWVPNLLVLGNSMFMESFDISAGQLIWSYLSTFISFVMGIWSFIIMINAISEAHQFSRWRGFWTIVIPGIIIFFVLLLFLLPILFML